MSPIASVRKFIVAAVGVAIAFGLVDAENTQEIVAALTAIGVYLVPNG